MKKNYPLNCDGYMEDEAFEALEERLDRMATKSTMPKSSPLVATSNKYYDVGGISTIDFIKAKLTPEQYKGFLLGTIIKYSSRLNHKGSATSDAKKLSNYSNWLDEVAANEHKTNYGA